MPFSKEVNPWFWSKNCHFSNFFYGKKELENILYDILERKNIFLGYKNKKLKKSKNWLFPKKLTHGFGPKMAIFLTFFYGKIELENILYDILARENAFLGNKIKKFKKRLTHGFGPIMAIFLTFFSGKIDQQNILYDILERNNIFLGYKNKKFKKSQKLTFS